jgi:proteasome regulatory subunit
VERELTAGSKAEPESQEWAVQRRIEDVFAKLGEKFGDLAGRVDVKLRPDVSFDQIGGLREAKAEARGLITALVDPEAYKNWGIAPPRGLLVYGPPGTGKSLLARALAKESGAIFYHLKLRNLTAKFGPNTGELLQEVLGVAKEHGKAVIFLDEADALSLDHLLPQAQAREASGRLVAALCEKLDALEPFSRLVVVAATNRTDAVDASLVSPGRLDRLVEAPLPDGREQQEILELTRAAAERAAGRQLVDEIDYRSVLPPMGGMSGSEIAQMLRRALEEKVQAARAGGDGGLVTTQDLLRQIDAHRRIRAVVEKIRYGQYL